MMTHVDIVKAAIDALNRNKNVGMWIEDIYDDGHGGVNLRARYPEPIEDWDDRDKYYGFTEDWFKSEKIDIESYSWMDGFKVSDKLRATNPEAVMILRIAYYFYKHGKEEGVI